VYKRAASTAQLANCILLHVIPTKTLKMVSAASLALRVAQRIKKQSVHYTPVKENLIQSWSYKTLAVIKRHKKHLSLSFYSRTAAAPRCASTNKNFIQLIEPA